MTLLKSNNPESIIAVHRLSGLQLRVSDFEFLGWPEWTAAPGCSTAKAAPERNGAVIRLGRILDGGGPAMRQLRQSEPIYL